MQHFRVLCEVGGGAGCVFVLRFFLSLKKGAKGGGDEYDFLS